MAIIFSDNFETGTLLPTDAPPGAWNGIATSAGESVTVVANPYVGKYAGKASCDGSAAGENAYVHKTFGTAPNYTTIYARAYIMFKTNLPAEGNTFEPLAIASETNWSAHAEAYNRAGDAMRWSLIYFKGAAETQITDLTNAGPALDTWYCVELYVHIDAVSGAVALYIDGVQRLSDSGFNNSPVNDANKVFAGERLSTGQTAHDTYFDCLKVSDQYIGLEIPASLVTRIIPVGVPHSLP